MKCITVSPAVHALLVKTQAKLALERGQKIPLHFVLEEILKDHLKKE